MAKPSGGPDRAEKKRMVRRSICDAALRLSSIKGFSGLSLREITREAGIAAPSFYNHFTDLEDLGLAIIDEAGVTLRQLLRRARKTTTSGESVVRRSVETFDSYLRNNAELFHFLFAERVGGTRAFRLAIEREMGHIIEDYAEALAEASASINRPIAHPLYVADLIVNCAFNAGAEVLSTDESKRNEIGERAITQIRIIMYGAEMLAAKASRRDINESENALSSDAE
ncbi:MAG: HTH-type transcriptional repressor FabR [Pseudomonadales bacterium]|uniref:Transcriptional regulator n=1 Tax=Oleiphilus messinensis TaxID=141451 RepID=A0A1Y0I181_9GAMM|nr:HTH-type transcriptional repressor FabR [Oleiphilus messinensis]ARU54218.1 transcriptional regulator [Oleiphilus messinensis]MCG8609969.1 HTH-type transcriptional repressor FabR [Pseudomonadales bacterium]